MAAREIQQNFRKFPSKGYLPHFLGAQILHYETSILDILLLAEKPWML